MSTPSETEQPRIRAELSRFIVIGVMSVLIDFVVYRALLGFGVGINLSKLLGFCTGAVFSFAANKSWTFQAQGGVFAFVKFASVYVCSLSLNVLINKLVVDSLPAGELAIAIGFLAATGFSAAFNFCGLKWFVFTDKAGQTGETWSKAV